MSTGPSGPMGMNPAVRAAVTAHHVSGAAVRGSRVFGQLELLLAEGRTEAEVIAALRDEGETEMADVVEKNTPGGMSSDEFHRWFSHFLQLVGIVLALYAIYQPDAPLSDRDAALIAEKVVELLQQVEPPPQPEDATGAGGGGQKVQ